MSKVHLQAVDGGTLPDYPVPAKERLQSHYFMPWHFNRWLNSEFRLLADADVRGVGFDLFCISQNEGPVGTLPVSDALLARLVGMTLPEWQLMCQREIGPLHNWIKCNCDGEVRYMHPVVLEMVEGAVTGKERALEKQEADRTRKRLLSLKAKVAALGAARLADSPAFINRLDVVLTEMQDAEGAKYRTDELIRRAMDAVSVHS